MRVLPVVGLRAKIIYLARSVRGGYVTRRWHGSQTRAEPGREVVMDQAKVSPFQKALDAVEVLPPEDQEMLMDVVRHRLIEQRRTEIARNAAATIQSVREGRAHYGSVEDLERDLAGDS